MQSFLNHSDYYNYAFAIDIGRSGQGEKDWSLLFCHRFAASASRTRIMDTDYRCKEETLRHNWTLNCVNTFRV
jgi:hypothetical protein